MEFKSKRIDKFVLLSLPYDLMTKIYSSLNPDDRVAFAKSYVSVASDGSITRLINRVKTMQSEELDAAIADIDMKIDVWRENNQGQQNIMDGIDIEAERNLLELRLYILHNANFRVPQHQSKIAQTRVRNSV
jgi:hypothetical protein